MLFTRTILASEEIPQRATRPMVEMGGIEPPSIAVILRLLRAQSVETFYSAPTFITNT